MFKSIALCLCTAGLLAAAELPTPEQVLNRYVEATGGADAYKELKTQTATGTIEFKGMGFSAKIQTFAAKPDNSATIMDLGGMGQVRSGVSNGIAWELSPMQGPRLIEGPEKELSLRTARLDGALRWKELYKDVKVEASEEVAGFTCFRISATPVSGGKPELSWYDSASGLLVKSSVTLVSPMGEMPLETFMDDYRPVGKLRLAHKMTQKAGPQEFTTTIESVQINVDIPASQFAIPPDIEALIKKAKQ
jgi:hypothetical protein